MQVDSKQHAHDLIDRMAPGQVSAVVGLLEVMLDPLARALAEAPYDDEPTGEDEASLSAESGERELPNAEVLAEFGLTEDDFERLGRTPLQTQSASQ